MRRRHLPVSCTAQQPGRRDHRPRVMPGTADAGRDLDRTAVPVASRAAGSASTPHALHGRVVSRARRRSMAGWRGRCALAALAAAAGASAPRTAASLRRVHFCIAAAYGSQAAIIRHARTGCPEWPGGWQPRCFSLRVLVPSPVDHHRLFPPPTQPSAPAALRASRCRAASGRPSVHR